FFIGKNAFELQGTDICERHTNILGLAASISAHHVGISKQAGTGISIGRFHSMGIWIGVVTGRPDLLITKLAIPACDREWYDYAIAPLQVGYVLSGFFDNPHELVSENVTFFHG